MDQNETNPKDTSENENLASEEGSGVLSSDPDDATAVAGNQQTEEPSENQPSSDVEISAANVASANPETVVPEDERKPSAVPVLSQSGGKANASSFAQLVKSWETYISDAQNVDTFQPMQMLQNLRLCGAGHELPRLTLAPSTDFTSSAEGQDPFEPIILRHTHSTPLQYRPSFFNDYDNSGGLPPPSELNPTRRSSSTPSRGSAFQQFSARSAFGSHLHTSSNLSGAGGRSAFGFPLHRSTYSGVSTESSIRNSAFNPVPSSLSTTQEEPPQEENTSIEVMDLGREEPSSSAQVSVAETADEEQGAVEVQIDAEENDMEIDQAKPKKSAAARAARFLSDVGVLRRKKKGARSSIMTVISSELGTTGKKDEEGSEKAKEALVSATVEESKSQESDSDGRENAEDFAQSSTSMYHQLDSDMDEEFDRYQSIENSAGDSDDSPRTIPSPDYHPMEDDRVAGTTEVRRPAVRIQVSSYLQALPQIAERIAYPTNTTSPNPDQIVDDDHSGTPTSSSNSPGGATRSSATTNTSTSGHTTQATSTTSTTGNASGHSQISETDREVMETIKEGKRRRRQETNPATDKHENDITVTIDSSSSTSSTTNGYVALSGSPGPLRDGANVVADRFFTHSEPSMAQGGYPSCSSSVSAVVGNSGPAPYAGANARARTLSLSRKSNSDGSPTSCSLNSIEEAPPTFVSYLDRQAASDLTSLRAATEVSTCRGDVEEREDSPAQIVGFSSALLGGEVPSDGQENAMSVLPKLVLPSTEHLYSMLDKFRSRPPRSLRTMTPTTPPPRLGSPTYQIHQLSPPRKIVDHRVGSNVARPYVVRTNPSTQKVVLVSPGAYVRPTTPLVCIPVGSPNYSPNQNRPLTTWPEQQSPYGMSLVSRTYEEHSIEILKTDSKDEMICQR